MKFVLEILEKRRDIIKSTIHDLRDGVGQWKTAITQAEEDIATKGDELSQIEAAIEKLKA